MKKLLIGLFLLIGLRIGASTSSSFESSSLETSSDEIVNPYSLQSQAITIINMDMKRRVYQYLRRKAREIVQAVVTNTPESLAYSIAKDFFISMRKQPSDIELLLLAEYIHQIPLFSITTKMIEKKYSFMTKISARNGYGIAGNMFGYLICSYKEKDKRLQLKINGIDYCSLFTLVDIYDVIDRYIKKYEITNVESLLFDIRLSKYNEHNDILIQTLQTILEQKSIIFSTCEGVKNFHTPHSVSRLKNVKQLFFCDNAKIYVGKNVSKIKDLRALIIEYKKMVMFSEKFSQMDSLESFMLKKNDKIDTNNSYVPRSVLQGMPNLTHLHLEDYFENMPQLLQVIASMSSLKRLYIEPYYHNDLPESLEKKIISKKHEHGYFALKNVLKSENENIRQIKRSKSLSDIALEGQY